jgi:hypothetical protein
MPDITMCLNKECPLRGTCYRFNAKADPHWQSYSDFKPDENGKCDNYWDRK